MKIKVDELIPIMQCPKCKQLKKGGNRRPGIDEIHGELFLRCKHCRFAGFVKPIYWMAEGETIGGDVYE